MINTYVALDIETTGLDPKTDRIIEIGMIKIKDGIIEDCFATLINPGIGISDRIQELTGISDEELTDKPVIDDVIGKVIEFIGDYPILGHNIIFDYSFLKKAAVDNGYVMPDDGIDTLKMARRIVPEAPHKNLSFLCEYLGIPIKHSHRALDDAVSACAIYEKMYLINPEDEGYKATEKLVFSVKKDTPATDKQKKYLMSLISKHNVQLEIPIDEITRSMASRVIDGIISTYGK